MDGVFSLHRHGPKPDPLGGTRWRSPRPGLTGRLLPSLQSSQLHCLARRALDPFFLCCSARRDGLWTDHKRHFGAELRPRSVGCVHPKVFRRCPS